MPFNSCCNLFNQYLAIEQWNMKSYLKYLVFIISLNIMVSEGKWRCDYNYIQVANGYFKFHQMPATWHDARLRCQLEGAVLASPYPQEIHDVLLAILGATMKGSCVIFTGIHATFSKGDFYTVDGTPLSKIPIKWMELEPDNKDGEENCLVLTSEGVAADVRCSETHPYFCYKEKTDTTTLNSCGATDSGYEYSDVTRSCYKFHTVPRTWSRAHMACSAEGGHLLIINSKEEAEFVKKLFAKYPARTMIGNFWKDVAFVGFQDWNEHGDWRTIHGETLYDAGYAQFSLGEPNNSTTGEYCGSIYRSALYNDLWCENHYAFICEKNPNSLVCDDEEN